MWSVVWVLKKEQENRKNTNSFKDVATIFKCVAMAAQIANFSITKAEKISQIPFLWGECL